MAQIGSFALLLALALSAYSFLAGLLALLRPGAGSERLGETARRAGIAAFAVVLLAAVVLVIAAFQEIFPSPTFSITAIATFPRPTSLRLSGQGRKVRCCSGRCCCQPTDWSCGCVTKLTAVFSLTLR